MANLPQMSSEQRDAALAKAGEVRRARSELKSLVKMGSISLVELFERAETDDVVGKTKVLAAAESLPGVGKVRARRALEEAGIADNRRLAGLGRNQRAKLLELLG